MIGHMIPRRDFRTEAEGALIQHITFEGVGQAGNGSTRRYTRAREEVFPNALCNVEKSEMNLR